MCECDSEPNAQLYCAASPEYHVPHAEFDGAASLEIHVWFSDITTVCGCDSEPKAQLYSAASLEYHVTYTHPPSHCILTTGQPDLALPLPLSSFISS